MNAVQLEPGIPLKGYFNFITFFGSCEITNFFEERFFGIIEVANKIADSAVILKFCGYWGLFSFIFKGNSSPAFKNAIIWNRSKSV